MSNAFEQDLAKVGHVTLNIVDGKYIATALSWTEKAAAVIATAVKDQPELKTALTTLVQKAEAIGADALADVAGKGLDFASDAKTLADIQAFFQWIMATLVPLVESVYHEVKTDLTATPTTTTITTTVG